MGLEYDRCISRIPFSIELRNRKNVEKGDNKLAAQ